VLAAQTGSPQALAVARSLTSDADPAVRADATFTLGSLGDLSLVPVLAELARGGDVDVATNAVGALARIARRTALRAQPDTSPIVETACSLLADRRATVRANALATIAIMKRRCDDGRLERKLLAEDASELVRGNAARVLAAAEAPDDRTMLDRCSSTDRSAEVARLCRPRSRATAAAIARTHPVTIFIVGEGATSTARPHAPFLLGYEDGILRAGVADRRGATFDPAAPAGDVVLRRPPTP